LVDEEGRQTWRYLESDAENQEWPQSIADKYHLGLPTVLKPLQYILSVLNSDCVTGSTGITRGQDAFESCGEWIVFLFTPATRAR
jgi:hypothetical protein